MAMFMKIANVSSSEESNSTSETAESDESEKTFSSESSTEDNGFEPLDEESQSVLRVNKKYISSDIG
jgi:hypothetical protein